MDELIIAELETLTFSVDNRHNREEYVSKEFYNEYGLVRLELVYHLSKDLETILDVDVYDFSITDGSGEIIDTNITDSQILNAITY